MFIRANESVASRRRVYFHLVGADGISPVTGENGQAQVSLDGAAWTNTGISVVTEIGNGRYHAELTQAAVDTAGRRIETRYKSANTVECPGDSVQVVAFNPNDADGLGLSRLDAAVTTRLATAGYTAPANSDITAIKAKTDNLPSDPASVTAVNTRLAASSYTAPDNAGIASVLSNQTAINTNVLSRLAASSYTAPANSDIAAIKAKTDNLPADPASNTQVNTRLATAGYTAPPTAAQVATAVWSHVVEGTRTAGQLLRLLRSALMAKATGLGTRTTAETLAFRDEADTKTRATVTISTTGERSVVIGDLD